MTKSPHAFRSIGEVARLVGVATHVLRYWEAQFPQLSPVKRADGRRYYRPDDVLLVAGICEILREEGLTIRGAKRLMAQDRGEALRARGMVKLGEQLGLTDLPEDPRPAKPARPRNRPAKTEAPAVQPDATLPLFPELQPAAGTDNVIWLERLTATAAALRTRDQPLPSGVRQIADALRDALPSRARR